MTKRKINYIKRWDNQGTCYSQGVNITQRESEQLLDCLRVQKIMNKQEIAKSGYDNIDYTNNLYLNTPLNKTSKIIFTNHTQRKFFNKFLKIKNLKDRNTCFIINK